MWRSTVSLMAAGLLTLASTGIAAAQAPTPAKTAPQTPQKMMPTPQAPPATTLPTPQPQTQPSGSAPSRPPGQLANIRLELTITEQRGTTAAAPKTVSMLVMDRFVGRIRTSSNVRIGPSGSPIGTNFTPITLNVDAEPEILRDGRIKVFVNLEYRAQVAEGAQEDNQPANVTESFSVIVEDGKSVLVSQSADPATDRKVRVEMKAAIVK